MSLIVSGTEIENVIVIKRATGESIDIEKLQDSNGVEIWSAIDPALLYYILNVTSVDRSDYDDYGGIKGIEFNLTVGEKGATVSFNGEEKVLDTTATVVVFNTSTSGVTGDIVFKGDFSNVRTGYFTNNMGTLYSNVSLNNIVQFPQNMTELYANQFAGASIDFTINIPNTFKKLDMNAFYRGGFSQGTTNPPAVLNFGNNIEEIVACTNPNAYTSTSYFTNATLSGGVFSINNCAMALNASTIGNVTDVTIPNNTRLLANGLCRDAYNMTTLTLPTTHSIKKIPEYFCDGASKLTAITIPNGVETIGLSAFELCSALATVSLPSSVHTIGERAFYDCGVTTINITNNIKHIGASAFYSCGGLTSLTVPSSIETIENSAFSGCSGLTSLTIPNSVKTLGNNAFSGCTKLTDVTIPASISKIGNVAFGQTATDAIFRFLQPSGMAVELPTAGVNGMFYYKSAQTITIYTDNETIKNYDYSADGKTATIYHLDGSAWA